jgi:DNA-binding XRE family transcriptional regulator
MECANNNLLLTETRNPCTVFVMKLADYLHDAGLTRHEFAAQIGASHETVRLWLAGDVLPQKRFWDSINKATDGRVTFIDFVDAPEQQPEAAQ